MIKKPNLLFLFLGFVISVNIWAQPINRLPVEPKRESARATLKTFLEAFQQPRVSLNPDPLEEAVKCLDLQSIPSEYRALKGLESSVQIKEIIDSVENFHPEDAPVEKDGPPFVIFRSQLGEIVIARQATGEWLFTRETIQFLPLLLASIEDEKRRTGTAILTQSESIGSQIREKMPPVLKQNILFLELWQWLGLLILLIFGVLVWRVTQTIVSLTLGNVFRRHYPTLTDEQIKNLYSPIGLLAAALIFRPGLRGLALTQNSLTFFRTLIFILTAVSIIWFAYRTVDLITAGLRKRSLETESQTDDLLVPFISVIMRIAIVVTGSMVVAENLDFNVTSLIAGLGIGGIAIALASQETLSNFFGSLVLLIERPFTSKDHVSIDGIQGTIKEIGLRSTRILTIDNSLITLPNSNIAKATIINEGIKGCRSWVVKISVPYKNGAQKVEQICAGIKEIITKSEFFNREIFKIHLFDLVPPSLILRVELNFVSDNDDVELAGRHQFIMEILRLADQLAIELEVPN